MMKHYEKNPPLNMMVKAYLGIGKDEKTSEEEVSFDDFMAGMQGVTNG